MNYLILSDYLREDMPNGLGGAELALEALIELIREDGNGIKNKLFVKRCAQATPEFIKDFNGSIIVSNRQQLSEDCRKELYKKRYLLYEHDFSFLRSRDAGMYEDLKAPEDQIINREIYERAEKVVCQSFCQSFAVKQNLGISAICTKGNPWSQKSLDFYKTLQEVPKQHPYGVMLHPYETKGTAAAIKLCEDNDWQYTLIPPMAHKDFVTELAKCQIFVFTPEIFETFSRVCQEARFVNTDLIVNQRVAFNEEDYSRLKGLEAIERAERNNKKIREFFLGNYETQFE